MALDHPPVRISCRRCRARLSEPTSNDRSAFCCAGCHRIYYASRCMVCDLPKTGAGTTCGKRACGRELAAFKRHGVMGKFYQKRRGATQVAKTHEACSETPIFIGSTG